MGTTHSTSRRKSLQKDENTSNVYLVPQGLIQLSLCREILPSFLWLDHSSNLSTASILHLPQDIIDIIFTWILSSLSLSQCSNISVVCKTFYVICNRYWRTKCTELFGMLHIQNAISNELFFKDRWCIFYQKYLPLLNLFEDESNSEEEQTLTEIYPREVCDVCFYGDVGVGKSSLMEIMLSLIPGDRITSSPQEKHITTKKFKLKEKRLEDRAFNTLKQRTKQHIPEHVVFLVFDETNRNSLEHLRRYLKVLSYQDIDSTRTVLVGNKMDLTETPRSAEWSEAINKITSEHCIPFVECSATSFTGMYQLLYLIWSYPHHPGIHTRAVKIKEIDDMFVNMD